MLFGWVGFLISYKNFDDQAVTNSNLSIPVYLIKIKHKVVWVCASFKLKDFHLRGCVKE
jgi:hypothetical protein